MATEGFKRKLTAILSADAVGYSRLMGEDEPATLRTLETYKRVISDLIQQHRGRMAGFSRGLHPCRFRQRGRCGAMCRGGAEGDPGP